MERDPRSDPRTGDVLKWNGELWLVEGVSPIPRGWNRIWGARGHENNLDIAWGFSDVAAFQAWAKNAKVIHRAD